MNGVRKVTEDLYWVGVNDKRIELFENIHPIPEGVSYNAYLLLDEKTVLFDTVDWSGCRVFLEAVPSSTAALFWMAENWIILLSIIWNRIMQLLLRKS